MNESDALLSKSHRRHPLADPTRIGLNIASGIGQLCLLFICGFPHSVATDSMQVTLVFSLLACLCYVVYLALPHTRNESLLREVGHLTALSFSTNMVWFWFESTFAVNNRPCMFAVAVLFVFFFGVTSPLLVAILRVFTRDCYSEKLTSTCTAFFECRDRSIVWFAYIPISAFGGVCACISLERLRHCVIVCGATAVSQAGPSWLLPVTFLITAATAFSMVIVSSRGNMAFSCACAWCFLWYALHFGTSKLWQVEPLSALLCSATFVLLAAYTRRHCA
jgi:hypothetical protein